MSGLVSGLQNRVRRFESARNLKGRKFGWVAETTSLLNWRTGNRTGGSNPPASARIKILKISYIAVLEKSNAAICVLYPLHLLTHPSEMSESCAKCRPQAKSGVFDSFLTRNLTNMITITTTENITMFYKKAGIA